MGRAARELAGEGSEGLVQGVGAWGACPASLRRLVPCLGQLSEPFVVGVHPVRGQRGSFPPRYREQRQAECAAQVTGFRECSQGKQRGCVLAQQGAKAAPHKAAVPGPVVLVAGPGGLSTLRARCVRT